MSVQGHSRPTQSARKRSHDRNTLKADTISPACMRGMFVILVTEEYDHARQWKLRTSQPPHALEQRQADRGETSPATKARLVD
jgi:hypothetical protein